MTHHLGAGTTLPIKRWAKPARIICAAVAVSATFSACASDPPPTLIATSIAPPSCARPRAIIDYSYLFFFDADSSAITPRAQGRLIEFASSWERNGGALLELYGYTDRQERRTAEPILAVERADAVKAFLVSHGIEAKRIVTEGLGASHPLVPSDGPEPQNRRVEGVPFFKHSDQERMAELDRLTCKIWVSDHCFTPSRLTHAGAAECTAALNTATSS